jgi:hypothetical protein
MLVLQPATPVTLANPSLYIFVFFVRPLCSS